MQTNEGLCTGSCLIAFSLLLVGLVIYVINIYNTLVGPTSRYLNASPQIEI